MLFILLGIVASAQTPDILYTYSVGSTEYTFRKVDSDGKNFPTVLFAITPGLCTSVMQEATGSLSGSLDVDILDYANIYVSHTGTFASSAYTSIGTRGSANDVKPLQYTDVYITKFIKVKTEIMDVPFRVTSRSTGRHSGVDYMGYVDGSVIHTWGISAGLTTLKGSLINIVDGSNLQWADVNGEILPVGTSRWAYSVAYQTPYVINYLRFGIQYGTRNYLEMQGVSHKARRSNIKKFMWYSHVLFPLQSSLEDVRITEELPHENGVLLPGNYNILHEEVNGRGGFVRSGNVGLCAGFRYFRLPSVKQFGFVMTAEGGTRPSFLINTDWYQSGLRQFPLYFQISIGLLFSSM